MVSLHAVGDHEIRSEQGEDDQSALAPLQVGGGLSGFERIERISRDTERGDILDNLAATIARYCVLPTEEALVGVTLWAAMTHLIDCFDSAPRLVLRSGEKQSGKTRLLNDVLGNVVANPLRNMNVSGPFIFRALDQSSATLLIDEADTIFGNSKVSESNEAFRGILNAGFQRGSFVGRTTGPTHEPKSFPTFAMAALAGIGRMPDTIEDRAIVVQMARRRPDQEVAPFRQRRDQPVLHQLRDRLESWASDEELQARISEYMPEDLGLEDRPADVWEPLIAVADMVSPEWGQRARVSSQFLVNEWKQDEEENPAHELLDAIRSVLVRNGWKVFSSKDLCNRLNDMDGMPWSDDLLTPVRLGIRLRPYRIKPRCTPGDPKRKKFYHASDFAGVFGSYLPPLASPTCDKSAQSAQSAQDGGSHGL